MKRLVRSTFLYSLFSILYSIFPSPVFAQSAWSGNCVANVDIPNQGTVEGVATILGFRCLFENILSVALRFIGLAMFIMVIVGGFKILTAGEDAKATEAGKQTITMGIVGLALAIGAWFVLLAIRGFTGVDLTQFNIPTF